MERDARELGITRKSEILTDNIGQQLKSVGRRELVVEQSRPQLVVVDVDQLPRAEGGALSCSGCCLLASISNHKIPTILATRTSFDMLRRLVPAKTLGEAWAVCFNGRVTIAPHRDLRRDFNAGLRIHEERQLPLQLSNTPALKALDRALEQLIEELGVAKSGIVFIGPDTRLDVGYRVALPDSKVFQVA